MKKLATFRIEESLLARLEAVAVERGCKKVDLVEAGLILAFADPPASRVSADSQRRDVEARVVQPVWASGLVPARALVQEPERPVETREPFYEDGEVPDAW